MRKLINLLHHICLYVRKSWIMSSQYMCICRIWVAAYMQRRCCSSVYVQASTRQWSHCYYLAFQLCANSMHEYSAVTALSMLMRLFSSSDKHSLQKVCSQHLVQINLVVDQFTSESVSNLHTMSIKLQKHYWKRKSRSINQKRCSRIISYQQHENNHHKLCQKANLQRDEITMIKCLKKQHQEEKSVSKAHIECEFKSEIIKRA